MISFPPDQVPTSTIASAVDSVFHRPEFNRFTLWQQLTGWLGEHVARWLGALFSYWHFFRASGSLFWFAIAAASLIVVGIIGRAVYLAVQRRVHVAYGLPWEMAGRAAFGRDPWRAAQELAARGEFTPAAHALYAALLQAAARQQQVRLHPSKTVGDYVRELRRRSSTHFDRFREFARTYEMVIYGLGYCDEPRYERLRALVAPIVSPNG